MPELTADPPGLYAANGNVANEAASDSDGRLNLLELSQLLTEWA